MKSTLKTQVAAIFTWLTIATGIANAQGPILGDSTAKVNNSQFLPPIVYPDKLTNQEAGTESGILSQKAGQSKPEGTLAQPVPTGMLAPIAVTEVDEKIDPFQQVTTTENSRVQYPVRQAVSPALPPIVQGTGRSANTTLAPQNTNYLTSSGPQGSGTRGSVAAPQLPAAATPLPFERFPLPSTPTQTKPFPTTGDSMVVGQGVLLPTEITPGSVISSDCNTCDTGSAIGQPVFHPPSFAAPVIGCDSCSTGAVSNCTSCGTNGCSDASEIDRRFAACGFISRARNYALLDVLYFNREGGEPRTMNLNPASEFDGGVGARFTIGRRQDAANGREFTYVGAFDLDDQGTVTDPLGRITPRFVPDGTFLGFGDLTGFANVTTLSEEVETQFHSFEYNRVRWGWDVVKVLFGARYILLEDEYTSQTVSGANTGSFEIDAINHMIGPQIGAELFYDVGYRWSVSGFGKIGYLLNAFDSDFEVINNDFPVVDGGDDSTTGTFLLDLGITGHYQLSSNSRFRLGYNLLYFDGVASSEETVPFTLSPFTTIDGGDDDAFFHGLSLGFEIYR